MTGDFSLQTPFAGLITGLYGITTTTNFIKVYLFLLNKKYIIPMQIPATMKQFVEARIPSEGGSAWAS